MTKTSAKPPPAPPSPAEDDVSSESSADEMVLVEGAGWDEDHSSSEEDEPAKKKKRTSASASPSAPTDYQFTMEEMSTPFFFSVRTMLQAEPFYAGCATTLADKIVEQASVGTVVTQPDDAPPPSPKSKKSKTSSSTTTSSSSSSSPPPAASESEDNARSIFGFATLLNTSDEELSSFLPQLISSLPKAASSFASPKSGSCGLLVSSIMINLPHSLTQSLHTSLLSDVAWAQANATGDGGAERELYKFKTVLVVSQLEDGGATDVSGIKADSKGRWTNLPPLRKIIDEYIIKHSTFEPVAVSARLPGGEGSVRYLVGGVKWADFEKGIKSFEQEV
ncbi:hypothetical protein TeGR_g360 [Tetraparma gracilis]|uniref:Uncharacterized protein n=1 Tax=Tetraparma gracilis TaxID=2962635 RepID=A0ABQ6MD00_9STRA|nr:hypothetical protein TeGR_g360 [Tetraparma gracilis]